MLKKNRVEKTFAISFALHLLVLLAVSIKFPKVKPNEKLEIAFIEVKKKNSVKPVQQVVPKAQMKMAAQEIKPTEEKESKDAKYLSEHIQVVKKQTRAIHVGKFKNSKTAGRAKLKTLTPKIAQKAKAAPVEEASHLRTASDAEIAMRKALEQRPQIAANPKAPKENIIDDSDDESSTNDHIIADTGVETLINTREFKYYAYCKRIKDKIQILWEPRIKAKVLKNLNGVRSIAAVSQEKTTKTIIILDSTGTLERVQVIGASGLQDLDESAVEAFRAAAPFPNPPKGIIDPDGKIRIRWDFVLSEANE